MSNAVNRYTLNHESLKNDFRQHKKLGQALWLREQIHNAYSHNATFANIITINPSSRSISDAFYMVTFLHDGDKFETHEQIMSSLQLGVSNDQNKGVNGSGGKLSGLFFLDRESDYQPTILAKLPAGNTVMYHAVIGEYRDIKVVRNTDEEVQSVIKCLGILWDKSNVAYLAPFSATRNKSGGDYAFQTVETMSVVPDMAPVTVGRNHFNITYFDNVIVSDKKPYGAMDSWEKSATTIISPQEFDRMFMDKKAYLFKGNGDFKTDGLRVNFDVEIQVKLYTGLRRNDGKGDNRYGLVCLRGQDKGAGKMATRGASKQKQNVFLFASWTDDKMLKRLNEDPYYAADQLDSVASILGLACSNRSDPYRDVNNHPELKEFITKTKDEISNLIRNPFVKIYVKITKVNSISDTVVGQVIPNWSSADIRSVFGGFNEVFMAKDKELSTKVIECALNAVVNDKRNAEDLESLRSRSKELWPVKLEKFCELPLPKLTGKERRLIFSCDGKAWNYQQPNTEIAGKLCYEQDGRLVNVDAKFRGIKGSRANKLVHLNNDKWMLAVCDYHLIMPDQTLKQITEGEYLSHPSIDTLPCRAIVFTDENTGLDYILNTRVMLPKNGSHRSGGTHVVHPDTPTGVDDVRSKRMFKEYGLLEKYVHFVNDEVILNTINSKNRYLWLNIPEKQSFREKLWNEINEFCRIFDRKISNILKFKGFTDENQSKEIAEKWGDDAKDYLLNLWIANIFESPRIDREIAEIKEKLAVYDPQRLKDLEDLG